MDYIIDFYNEYDDNGRVVFPEFIYDDRRKWSIIYTFLKLSGLIFYTVTLHTCSKPDFYIIMIVVMFLSTMNNIRYEYSHYKRYGTLFSSLDDFLSIPNYHAPNIDKIGIHQLFRPVNLNPLQSC